jgi:cytochrome oxidase assembly protein ShyY1
VDIPHLATSCGLPASTLLLDALQPEGSTPSLDQPPVPSRSIASALHVPPCMFGRIRGAHALRHSPSRSDAPMALHTLIMLLWHDVADLVGSRFCALAQVSKSVAELKEFAVAPQGHLTYAATWYTLSAATTLMCYRFFRKPPPSRRSSPPPTPTMDR